MQKNASFYLGEEVKVQVILGEMLHNQIIGETTHETAEYVSPTIIIMASKNFFLATIDLKDAYYSVAISRQFEKFFKFKWKDKLYCFTCFPNGLGSCPRKSTKLNKVPITTLHFDDVPLSSWVLS